MGQLVYIKAKAGSENDLNKKLKKAKIKNQFITAKMNQDWLDDINTNPKAYHRHLKPKDGDLTLEELMSYFESDTTIGLLSFDVAFSRTSDEEAAKYAEFIEANKDSLEYLKGADAMLDRFELTANQIKIFAELDLPTPEPEMLPEEEQSKPDLQGGLFLCKSWGLEPFWVIFGKVERPTFLKTRIFKNELYNNIYRDKKGHAYLMIPLLPLDNRQVEFVTEVYEHAASLGLRENYNFIIPLVYGLDLVNLNEVADNYKETYTPEELQDRFKRVFQMTSNVYPYNQMLGFVWRDDKKKFVPTGGEKSMQINTRCSILTSLVRALGSKTSAVLMTELTGKPYLEFEMK